MNRTSFPLPLLSRGRGRTASAERTFRPDYVSFAGTYQCNLACPHCCVPIEWTDRLPIPAALRFLEECRALGLRTLGLTGGEPFVYAEFVLAICRRGTELGYHFDKIATNGVWHRDRGELRSTLEQLAATGFSGKLGVSVDKFHGVNLEKVAEFCQVAGEVFQRDNIVSLSYASRRPDQGLELIHTLAEKLDAVLDWSERLGRYMLVSRDLTMTLNWNHLAPVERAERFSGAWDGTWFAEDYCEGPGQALIVNPRGEVKPCCGFASDLDQLTIGNLHEHSAAEIIRRGREHPYVGKVFREGLSAIRDEILAHDPSALPGATSNHCFFCWYVLSRGIFDQTRDDPAERVGSGGQWEKLRLSLPMVSEFQGPSFPESA